MEKLLAMYNLFLRNLILFSTSVVFLFAQTTHTVEVSNNVFTPNHVDIELGDTVEWIHVEGSHNVVWNALNAKSEKVPSGIYIYQLSTNDMVTSKRMTLLK